MVMGTELLFMFAPFAVVLVGLISDRYMMRANKEAIAEKLTGGNASLTIKVMAKLREVFAILISGFTLFSVWQLYTLLQASPTKILVVTLGGAPPIGAALEIDMLSIYMAFSAALLGLFATIYSYNYMAHDTRLTEYYTLLSALVVGIIGVAFAGDFFTFFVFWELMGIASYVLVAFRKENWGPIEAGFKYMVMGAVGSTMLLLGIALIYGMAGTVNFAQISNSLLGGSASLWMMVAMLVFIVGFGVKSAIVPLHTWLPDAHPEAPSPISAMLSGILIETALYGLARILYIAFPAADFSLAIAGLAVVTMSFANIVAVLQTDVKRMLAYSSIAQVGYMLVGVASGGIMGLTGLFLHVFNHSLMKGLAFLSAGSMIEESGTRDIDKMRGIAKVMPITSLTMFIALLGLGGVPGTAGFISKYLLFGSALAPGYWWLTVIAVLNSALSMVYYLRVMKALVGQPKEALRAAKEAPPLMLGVTVAMATLIILFGVWPAPMIAYATEAGRALLNLTNYVKVILP